jgi:hypothetical protein
VIVNDLLLLIHKLPTVICHCMEIRISSYALILYATLTSSLLSGILVASVGLVSTAQGQTTTGALGNLTAGDFDVVQESVNDAREAIHSNNTAEAMDELATAERALSTLTNATQTQTEPTIVEDESSITSENQTSTTALGNLTAGDFDGVQESVNDAREAIHSNNTASAVEELNSAMDNLLSMSNSTAS